MTYTYRPYIENMEHVTSTSPIKLACFIHSTTLDIWHDEFLITLLDSLKSSGLLQQLSHLCIVNTGLAIDHDKIEQKYKPAKVIHYSKFTNEYENITIKMLYAFCRYHPDYKVLYMHTKGVSYTRDHVFLPGIHSWNDFMMYSLVEKYESCISLLRMYDTVGCNYRPFEDGNGQHYSGNFWWATAKYISTLPISYMKNKYDPEFWLLQNDPLYFNIHVLEHMYQQTYPRENYGEDVKHGFEDGIYFSKVGFHGTGLCNQLYCIVNTLTLAASQGNQGNKVVVLDDFITDINSAVEKPSCDVLNLSTCNKWLKPHGITMMYKNHITMKLHCVLFGLRHISTVDITNNVRERYMTENRLHIPKGTFLNELAPHDPCPNTRKQIYIYYYLNDVLMQDVFFEQKLFYQTSIDINFSHFDGKPHMSVLNDDNPWLTRINRNDSRELKPLFDKWLGQLEFHETFHQKAQHFLRETCHLQQQYNNMPIHVIHLRNEDDALQHWSSMNSMTEEEYGTLYESTVEKLVRAHIPKQEPIIILTAKPNNNRFLELLTREKYTYFVKANEDIGREMNAIVDLLIGRACTGVFIGNYVLETHQGSTFSFTLHNSLPSTIRRYWINMDHIKG